MRLAIILATFAAVALIAAARISANNSDLCKGQSPGSVIGSISCVRELP